MQNQSSRYNTSLMTSSILNVLHYLQRIDLDLEFEIYNMFNQDTFEKKLLYATYMPYK